MKNKKWKTTFWIESDKHIYDDMRDVWEKTLKTIDKDAELDAAEVQLEGYYVPPQRDSLYEPGHPGYFEDVGAYMFNPSIQKYVDVTPFINPYGMDKIEQELKRGE